MAALQPVPHPTPLVGKAAELDKQRFAAIEHRADVVDRRAAIIQMMETNRIPALQTWQYYDRSMRPFLSKMHSHAQRLIAASRKDHEKPEEAYDDDDSSTQHRRFRKHRHRSHRIFLSFVFILAHARMIPGMIRSFLC